MEHWKSILFFAAAFISITRAQWNCDDSILPQPNIANVSQPNFQDMPQPYDARNAESLEVDSCEFYAKQNAKAHHTEKYDVVNSEDPTPVLRRGQPFQMAIRFDRPFKKDSDRVLLELTLGSFLAEKRGPPVYLPVTQKTRFTHEPSNWDISLSSDSGSSSLLTLQIQIPYTAAVGLWSMNVFTNARGANKPKKQECRKGVFILFNPWSKGDLVYMENDTGRQEYVLNDEGDLYAGVLKNQIVIPWNYAQFDMEVLAASVLLLEKSQTLDKPYIDFASRGDPISVVSTISAMVNSNDEDGVLEGRWKGSYEDGKHPSYWTGSKPILEQYTKRGYKPVKYGQCWVFAGLTTSIGRALGLPCRSVTNFDSVVDNDFDLVIRKYRNKDGSESERTEKTWNFHVWSECWMFRPDLPAEFSGWQAFDGTPELVDEAGIFRAGPAPVKAIRRGEIQTAYNSKLFSGATNSDVYYYTIDGEKTWLNKIDTKEAGGQIVTMKPSSQKHDITLTYKPQEGTSEERDVYRYAKSKLGNPRALEDHMKRKEKEDVCFKLRNIPKIMIGKKFKMFVDVANNSPNKRTITLMAAISSVYYNGVMVNKLKSDRRKVILQPSQKKTLVFTMGPNIYLDKLVEFLMMNIYVEARVFETNQTWATEEDFKFNKPPLHIEYHDKAMSAKLRKSFEVSFSFTNPLNITLKDCAIIMEGLGLIEYRKIKLGDLGPRNVFTHIQTITPKKAGSHRLCAVFTSRQIVTILGSKRFEVEEI